MESSKENILIDNATDCNIAIFIKCLFDEKYMSLVVSGTFTLEQCKAAFKMIYAAFLDLSGMVKTAEFDLLNDIFYTESRIRKIELSLWLQRESIQKMGMPFTPGFAEFKKCGHNLIWDKGNHSKEAFLKSLLEIESIETKYKINLEETKAELELLRKDRDNENVKLFDRRRDFVKILNRLQAGKLQYRIDRQQTSVEELACMISESNESEN